MDTNKGGEETTSKCDQTIEALQREVQQLRDEKETYLKTIHYLSTEVLRSSTSSKTILPSTFETGQQLSDNRRRRSSRSLQKDSPPLKCSKLSISCASPQKKIPPEIFALTFRYLPRDDLDKCQLVCKQWNRLIETSIKNLPKRVVRMLRLIEKGYVSLSATTKDCTKKYAYSLADFETTDIVFTSLKRILKNCSVKRWVICNVCITDEFVRKLSNTFKPSDTSPGLPTIDKLEMLAVNLLNISPDVFHRFLGKVVTAQQYFVDGVRNAVEQHFNHEFLQQPNISWADDLTIYDVRAVDNDEVVLEMGDDALMEFIFGHKEMPARSTLYLDGPNISDAFLKTCLLHFVEVEHTDKIISHVEFAHCHEQQVPTSRNITLEYEHEIQIEWSSKNKFSGKIMEARISRNGDSDNFCHLTLNLQPLA